MPLTLSPVTEDDNIDKLCAMEYEGWQTPHNPQLRHFRPAHNTPEEWIAYSKEKKLKSLASKNPKVFSLKVTDTDNGDMVGFAAWGINDNPEAAERTEAVWHPEGSVEREFAERFINGLWEYLGKRVTRPHMDLYALVVHPKHRKRGAGRMLIRWGIDKADELGIETVVSSLMSARVAYEKCGLGCIEQIPPHESLNKPYPCERWKELALDDLRGWLMWRPIGHDYVDGVDKAPWVESTST